MKPFNKLASRVLLGLKSLALRARDFKLINTLARLLNITLLLETNFLQVTSLHMPLKFQFLDIHKPEIIKCISIYPFSKYVFDSSICQDIFLQHVYTQEQ